MPQVTSSRNVVTIVNRKGLHARASAKLSRLAAEYDAVLMVHKDGQSANANSIMDLLMLVAHTGSEVELVAEGAQAGELIAAATQLIADGFGETGDTC